MKPQETSDCAFNEINIEIKKIYKIYFTLPKKKKLTKYFLTYVPKNICSQQSHINRKEDDENGVPDAVHDVFWGGRGEYNKSSFFSCFFFISI